MESGEVSSVLRKILDSEKCFILNTAHEIPKNANGVLR